MEIWIRIDNGRLSDYFTDKVKAIETIESFLAGPGMEFQRFENEDSIFWLKRGVGDDWRKAHNRLKKIKPSIYQEAPASGDDRDF